MDLIDYSDRKASPGLRRLQQVHRAMLADLLAYLSTLTGKQRLK